MVIIIGAGVSGLCVAHELEKRGMPYQLLEQEARPGGYINTLHHDPYQLEQGPNSYLLTAEQQQWLQDLGLGDEVLPAATVSKNRFIWKAGQYRALPQGPLSLLTSGFFSWSTKLKVLADLFAKPGAQVPEAETLASFFGKRFGQEVVNYAVDPFVSGIYAGSSSSLLVHQAFPQLVSLVQEHGSLLKGMAKSGAGGRRQSLTFKQGMDVLPKRLASGLTGLQLNTTAKELTWLADEQCWKLRILTQEEELVHHATHVVACLPAYALAPLIAGQYPEVAAALGRINYPPMVAIQMTWPETAMQHRFEGFGGLHPAVEKRQTLGNIWTSQVFMDRAPSGEALITAFVGGVGQEERYQLPDEELLRLVKAEQRADYGISEAVEPIMEDVQRWPRAIPQYDIHQQMAAKALTQAAIPSFHIAANWLGGISLSDCIRKGRALGQSLE